MTCDSRTHARRPRRRHSLHLVAPELRVASKRQAVKPPKTIQENEDCQADPAIVKSDSELYTVSVRLVIWTESRNRARGHKRESIEVQRAILSWIQHNHVFQAATTLSLIA